MSFEGSGYMVTEGDTVEVCVVLTGALERDITVNLSTMGDTATGIV